MDRLLNKRLGSLGESAVCSVLERRGYTILERNYQIRGGELDIIAKKSDIIAFVEVKTRTGDSVEEALASVSKRKQLLLIRTASHYLQHFAPTLQPRFDVAVVSVVDGSPKRLRYYPNAFDASS